MKVRSLLALVAGLCAGVGSAGFAATTFTWTGTTFGSFGPSIGNANNWTPTAGFGSSSANTALVFSTVAANGFPIVNVDSDFDAYSLTFSGSFPAYYFFSSTESNSLGVGAGGITVGSGGSSSGIEMAVDLRLLANQTWNIGGRLNVYGRIDGTSMLTKSGTGTLVLGSNTFSGGFYLQQGTLLLDESTSSEGSFIFAGPVGTGTLRLGTGTTLAPNGFNVTLANPILLESGVAFGQAGSTSDLTLTGLITLQAASTSVTLQGSGLTIFSNNIVDAAAGPSALTFTGGGAAILSGTNAYSGGTTVNGAGLIFYNAQALPTTGSISALNNAYVGVAYDGGVTTLVSKIGSPSTFAGSLGLDTPRLYDGTLIFNDSINLSSFSSSNLVGVGTYSAATLAGSITPVGAGNYKFGGGNGTLYVNTGLPASGSAGLTVSSPVTYVEDQRLTVFLRGTNTFTGNVNVTGSNLIFDAASALPTNVTFALGANGYIGYTENPTNVATFDAFRSRFSSVSATGIIGIDSQFNFEPRTVSDPIDLSSHTAVYLGTATSVNLTGTIKPPTGGTAYLTGVNGGYLKIGSALTTANGVSSVQVGYASSSPAFGYNGYVEFDSGSSNYSGNTTLGSGYLLLGASSTLVSTVITQGPIGTGTLVIPSAAHSPALAITSSSGVTLHNNISLGSSLAIHADLFTPTFTDYTLTLNGAISGSGGITYYGGFDGSLNLNGNNSFSGGFTSSFGQVVANTNTALGTGKLETDSTFFTFNTSAPVINGVNGFGGGLLVTTPNATLTINQQQAGEYGGEISSNGNNITVTKTGTGTLTLSGTSSYNGITNVNQGKLVLANSSYTEGSFTFGPVGGSTIALNGGELQVAHGYSIGNPITFTAPSRLSGNATFNSALTIGTNATLAPGASPGAMTFANGLTFASGGVFEIDIQSATSGVAGAGYTYDTLNVTGTLAFTSTSGSPFRLDLISLSTSGALGNVSDFSAANSYSWLIVSTTGGITGFTPGVVTINGSGFTNALSGGAFSVTTSGNNLLLKFDPVPEPSTWALLAMGLGGIAISIVRRRKSGR